MTLGRLLNWPGIALVVFAVAALLQSGGHLRRLESQVSDQRDRALQHESNSDIVIVGIDAQSLAQLQRWPWPRRFHAELIDALSNAAPKRVFFDIDFSSASIAAEDAALSDALARWPHAPINLPAFLQRASGASGELLLTEPLPQLAQHAQLAAVNVVPDVDGLVRRLRSSWNTPVGNLTSVPVALSGVAVPSDRDLPIDYSIAPSSFGFVSYADLLSGAVDPEVLAGKTVFVGAMAVELGDNLAVPLHRSLPGVVVLALAAQTLLDGPLQVLPDSFYLVALALWSVLAAWSFMRLSWRWNLALVFASPALLAAIALALFMLPRVLLEITPFVLTTSIAFMCVTLRSLDEQTLRAIAYAIGLRRRDAVLQSIVDCSADSIIGVDRHGRVQSVNPAALALLGRRADELLGAQLSAFLPALPVEESAAAELMDGLANRTSEWEAQHAAGNLIPVELSIGRVELREERLYTVIVRDISERRMQQRRLEYQAAHDPLTDLPNRRALNLHLKRAASERETHGPLTVLVLDLCRFKEVNDALGHAAGDQVLAEVARRLRVAAGSGTMLARIGGDEFTVVAQGHDELAIAALAHRISDSLRPTLLVNGLAVDLSVSIGIARLAEDAGNESTLMQHADVAMYVCKRRGSPFEYYDPAHDQYSARKLAIVSGLREAIATSQLHLHYQPKVNLLTGVVDGVEALLRWRHPELGVVNPAEFIAAAESTDLISPLTDWTLNEAVARGEAWRADGLRLGVAVNLSARVLQDLKLPERIAALIERHPGAQEFLELEITESAMMFDAGRALGVVERIRAMGVHIAVDDYGTGFASLGYLRDLPVQTLKLDKSFVTNLRQREDNQVIVASTIQMAHALKLTVVAEGVETEWEETFLQSAGCDFAQGYWYTRPLPEAQCLAWSRERNAQATVPRGEAMSPAERLLTG